MLLAGIYAALAAFAVCVVICPLAIPHLRRLKFGQNVRTDGPESHLKKTGTPTMGGVAIVLSIIGASLFFIKGDGRAADVLVMTASFGVIGFIDDYLKIKKKSSDGLLFMQKIIAQLIPTAYFIWRLYSSGADMSVYIPFTNIFLDLKYLTAPFIVCAVLGFVNGVNLTDGLDGLASGVTALVSIFLFFVAFAAGSKLSIVSGAAVGALLGFLLFNSHPAKVFMGDTGSLALGGLISATAIILRMPLVVALVGLIYFVESLSTMLQVGYFKLTKKLYGKGKRIFKMAPFHHHLEQCGYKETQVVAVFYIFTAVMCLIGFLATRNVF
ncbi:MAG: phospho-N-acetylmuramoyl-pentapeptide-transferase [Clostridiales bacterium]|nr:phospho-N-acetylmuramoyl-pentapeptide-transferase [Clostridiales bacterium]